MRTNRDCTRDARILRLEADVATWAMSLLVAGLILMTACVARAQDLAKPSVRLFDDLFVTGNGKNIDRIIEQTPNDARYFVGFVGWTAGELAKEIGAGYWYVGDPDAALVFRKNTDAMWEELVTRLGNGHA